MSGFVSALPGAVSQGLIWGIMAIGVYITFKILDIADLTVDGSFCTGGATFVVLFSAGVPVWTALIAAFAVGLLAGLVTGLLHTFCGIPAILSGILTQLGLWSVNLAIMGMKANVAINVIDTANLDKLWVSLRFVQDVASGRRPFTRHPILIVGLFTLGIIAVLYWFFGTGALSGALLSQYQSFADSSMGKGAIVIGLAAVIIGEALFSKIFRNFALSLLAVSLGAVIYYVVIQAVISLSNINSNYLKLISAVIVAIFLSVPYWKEKYFIKHGKKGVKADA